MTRGKFISIEGIEGAGKTTAMQYLKKYLDKANIKAVFTREPGGTGIAEEIRKVLLYPSSSETMTKETELLLMFAGRAQHVNHCIKPALEAGTWVVSDRFVDASYAYQGGGRDIDIKQIQSLDHWIVGSFYPDLTLLMDIPADLGCARAEKRGEKKDRIEAERLQFFMRVRETYLERARQDPNRMRVIDASLSLPAVEAQIGDIISTFIESKS
jgi:dTMP kinase